MYRIAICDDVPVITYALKKKLVLHLGEKVCVDCFISGESLFMKASKFKYDILIMDINLSGNLEIDDDEGMIISNRIKDIFPDTIVIFISGINGYEKRLVQFEPFRFLSKPIEGTELCEAVDAAIRRITNREPKKFCFQKNKISFAIKINEIMYFSSSRRIVYITAVDDTVDFYGRLDDVEKQIAGLSDAFVRIGKSFLVNMNYISNFSIRSGIKLRNGIVISISRSHKYSDRAVQKWKEFLRQQMGEEWTEE